jgi:hypothetical protein
VHGAGAFVAPTRVFFNTHPAPAPPLGSDEERLALGRFVYKAAAGRVPVVCTGTFGGPLETQARMCLSMAAHSDAVVVVTCHLAAQEEGDDVWLANAQALVRGCSVRCLTHPTSPPTTPPPPQHTIQPTQPQPTQDGPLAALPLPCHCPGVCLVTAAGLVPRSGVWPVRVPGSVQAAHDACDAQGAVGTSRCVVWCPWAPPVFVAARGEG